MKGQPQILQVADEDVRREAIFTSGHAFVWASAGTGKTHTLTLRALFLLLNSGNRDLYLSPERSVRAKAAREAIQSVVMTTFTRKAAAEMQTRLYEYLNEIVAAESMEGLRESPKAMQDPLFVELLERILGELQPAGTFQKLKNGAEALAEFAAEFQVSTIHSLAGAILRRHPIESRIPPTARFEGEDEEESLDLRNRMVDHWWRTQVFRSTEIAAGLESLLQVLPLAQIRSWLLAICSYPWIPDRLQQVKFPERATAGELLDATEQLAQILEGSGYSKGTTCALEMRQVVSRIRERQTEGWAGLWHLLDRYSGFLFLDAGTQPDYARRSVEQLPEELRLHFELSAATKNLAAWAHIGLEQRPQWQEWCRVACQFASWAEEAAIRELQSVSFDDMIRLAVRVMRKFPEVRRSESSRLRAILVDEFQDTDPEQLELFTLLLRSEAGTRREVLGFFVGDLKQSIYRFRKADIPSIQEFHRDFEIKTGCQLPRADFQLITSFRSLPNITSFVNHFFTDELGGIDTRQHLVPARPTSLEVPRWNLIEEDLDGQPMRAARARELAAEIAVRVIDGYCLQGGEQVPRYSDILILARKHSELDILLPKLHAAGIPVVSAGQRDFLRHHEVLDVLNLLLSLYQPGDTLALAAVLRSPIVCISDDHIHRLSRKIPPRQLLTADAELPDFLPEAAAKRILALRELFRARAELPPSEWLDRVSDLIPRAIYIKKEDFEGRSLVRIERVLSSFRTQLETGLDPPWVWLARERAKASEGDRFDADLGEDVSLADESLDAVRALTIHKAKGLEGKFVLVFGWSEILSELAGPGRKQQEEVLDLHASDGRILREFRLPWGSVEIETPEYGAATLMSAELEAAEALRLAYVATTRASERMMLLQPCWKTQKFPDIVNAFVQKCREGGSPGWLNFSVDRPSPTPRAKEGPEIPGLDRARYASLWNDRIASLQKARVGLLRHPSDAEHPPEAETTAPDTLLVVEPLGTGIEVGRLVHRYLERYLIDPPYSRVRLEQLLAGTRGRLVPGDVLDRAELILQSFFSGATRDRDGIPLITRIRQGRVIAREFPVYLTYSGEAWHGIIDLVLQEDDMVTGIDYKSSKPLDDLPASYMKQEEVYCEALGQLFGPEKVRFQFWWLEPES